MATNSMSGPFKRDGGLWHVPPTSQENLEWREVEPWVAEMKLVGYNRNRVQNTAFFLWVDTESNASYPMFVADMTELAQKFYIEEGHTFGRWTVVKRGTHYGLRMLEALDD